MHLKAIYAKHKVKYRSLIASYFLTEAQQKRRHQERVLKFPKVIELIESRSRVYFCDESIFSNKLYSRKVWAQGGTR